MDAVSARRVLAHALAAPATAAMLTASPLQVIAVGKAAAAMAEAFAALPGVRVRRMLAIGTHGRTALAPPAEWMESSHPYPDERSELAGRRALALAQAVAPSEVLVLLLSGGASALMAAPIDGISLDDKIQTTQVMMRAGADIHALNTVRRHLSRVKGGRLAAACPGHTLTLAISDVIGDDLSAIGSGPGVPDASTWADAARALEAWGGPGAHAPAVLAQVQRGVSGEIPEGPRPGDPACARVTARVIGGRLDAMAGAEAAAAARGYHPFVMPDPVTGEARAAAVAWWAEARRRLAAAPRPACLISSGETTVRVAGAGRGGRNLEFALSLAGPLASFGGEVACASVGTDGIDGSSGVAGGLVDRTTLARARALGLADPTSFLAANNSLAFFAPLDDTVQLGRTDTNVGDLQVLVAG